MKQLVRESKRGVIFAVHVVPRSARNEISGIHRGALRIRVSAPPVGGAANEALIALVAKTLKVPRRQVEIISGRTSRHKVLAVSGLDKDAVEDGLANALACRQS